jgi:hypothetical protein
VFVSSKTKLAEHRESKKRVGFLLFLSANGIEPVYWLAA